MDAVSARELRASLEIRWRNVLATMAGGGVFLAIGAMSTLFVGVPSKWVITLSTIGIGVACFGVAGYLNWTITQGETNLQRAGFPWKVDRTVLPFERRTLSSWLPRGRLLDLAVEVLEDPSFGLRRIRRTRRGVRALRPAVTRPPLHGVATVYPLDVQVRVSPRETGSELGLAIQPGVLWHVWPAPELATSWGEAESLADALLAALSLRLKSGGL